MELKDVILSTLAEMEESASSPAPTVEESRSAPHTVKRTEENVPAAEAPVERIDDEMLFLQNVRERMLVLFEGFQSPNNTEIEAKVDLTLNFLEYLLSTLEARIDHINKKERQ